MAYSPITPPGYGSIDSYTDTSSYQNVAAGGEMRDYPNLTRLVSTNIQKIRQNVADIDQMVKRLETATDPFELTDRLYQHQLYTSQLAKDTAKTLKEIRALPPAYLATEQAQRKAQTGRLLTDFNEVLNRLQIVQRDTVAKVKEFITKARAASTAQGTSSDLLIDLQEGAETQEQATTSQGEEDKIAKLQASNQRLEADIADINLIFTDLQAMMREQENVTVSRGLAPKTAPVNAGNKQVIVVRRHVIVRRRRIGYYSCGGLSFIILVIWLITRMSS